MQYIKSPYIIQKIQKVSRETFCFWNKTISVPKTNFVTNPVYDGIFDVQPKPQIDFDMNFESFHKSRGFALKLIKIFLRVKPLLYLIYCNLMVEVN